MEGVLNSEWGRLFQNWSHVTTTDHGFTDIGPAAPDFHRNVSAMFAQGLRVLATCIVEAPELRSRR